MKAVVLLILLISSLILAETVTDIRDRYREVKTSIERNALYISELTVNSKNDVFPAVGLYRKQLTYYWRYDEEQNSNRLLKIIIISNTAASTTTEEFLYSLSGDLIFYYSSDGYDDVEERYYFNRDRVIRAIKGDIISDNPDVSQINRGRAVQKAGQQYLITFEYSHKQD